MCYEIIKWISIGLCWVAVGINIYSVIVNYRNSQSLSRVQKIYEDALKELIKEEEEKENELFDKDN